MVYLNGASVAIVSKMQSIVALLVTESEYIEATECAQTMLFVMRVIESTRLRVKKPMKMTTDNSGAVDISHNWSSAGRTRPIDVWLKFLRELKEAGILLMEHEAGSENEPDRFTKNLARPLFEKHGKNFVGDDKYMASS